MIYLKQATIVLKISFQLIHCKKYSESVIYIKLKRLNIRMKIVVKCGMNFGPLNIQHLMETIFVSNLVLFIREEMWSLAKWIKIICIHGFTYSSYFLHLCAVYLKGYCTWMTLYKYISFIALSYSLCIVIFL